MRGILALLLTAVGAQKNGGGGTSVVDDDWTMSYQSCILQETDLRGGSCTVSNSDACSACGGSSKYVETIDGDTRRIRASGCPNNNPLTNCLGDNPSEAGEQDWKFDVVAAPRFNAGTYEASLSAALSLSEIGGIVGMTRNGVEVRSCYGGDMYGPCTGWSSSAVLFEADTFEYCGGHGTLGNLGDGSSPQLGWAADGFPMFGTRGPGGVLMKRCGADGADAEYCADACGGYYGEWNGGDDFLYRYFLMGDDEVIMENTLAPFPSSEFFPHAPLCLLGCGSVYAESNDRNPSIGSQLPACGGGASAGTKAGYAAEALSAVTEPFETAASVYTAAASPSPRPTAPRPSPRPSPQPSVTPGNPTAAPAPRPTPRPSAAPGESGTTSKSSTKEKPPFLIAGASLVAFVVLGGFCAFRRGSGKGGGHGEGGFDAVELAATNHKRGAN